ncbi:MAG: AI-2E family transporter [Clostridiales bacterium]|nr:AI-2E family transporter [Clostridiales bacterium]
MDNKSKGKFSFVKSDLAKTIILCGVILLVIAFMLIRYEGFFKIVGKVSRVFRPVLIGGIISFILNNPLNKINVFYQKLVQKRFDKKAKIKKNPIRQNNNRKLPFFLSVLTVYLMAIAIIAILLLFIIPQFIESIKLFIENFNAYYNNFLNFIDKNFSQYDFKWIKELDLLERLEKLKFSDVSTYIPDVIKTTFGITAGIFGFTISFISVIVDVVVGIVFSIYILSDKERLKRQAKSVTKMMFKEKTYERISYYTRLTTNTFTKFLSGQITEAFLLGVFCFIGMTVIGFEYPLMISTIVGITNIIPIVGPIFGTIPGVIVLLLVNPSHAIWFVIYIIILQQLESNLLYPRVVGSSVGLPPLWVLLAVLIGGGLGGVLGMIVAVPFMSIIYTIIKDEVNKKKEVNASVKNKP